MSIYVTYSPHVILHVENITFFEFSSSSHLVILGYPWLQQNNPWVDWLTEEVTFGTCLSCTAQAPAQSVGSRPDPFWTGYTCYHDLKEVFNKTEVTSLPPHCPHDCNTYLLPGTSPPKGRLYSLSGPEIQAMREYIQALLHQLELGFFVSKKDKSLCPCIDYRSLNNITIKNQYLIPLISSAFEHLQTQKYSLS